MFITFHAYRACAKRFKLTNPKRIRDEALIAMIFGKRKDNAFIYEGVTWGFNPDLTVLKTIY